MAYTQIATSGNTAVVSQEEWDVQCHRAYLGELKMKWLMGTDDNSVLMVKEDLTKKGGDAITLRYASRQQGGTVRGTAKGKGNEGSMSFYPQRFVVNNIRTVHKMEDVPMTEKRVSFSVAGEMKNALTTMHAETFDDDIVSMLCDTGAGRVRGRYIYGAADSNCNATHASALTNIDNTADQLTTSIMGIAKRKALLIGTGVSQKMKPTKVVNGLKQERWFILLAHTYCIRDLVNNDAAFRNAQLLLPPMTNRDSVFFTGSDYKGSWEGMLVYEYERLPLVSSTIQCAHNVLLGARAGVIAWGQRTAYNDETDDLGHDYIAEFHDIRNELVTGSSNNLKCVYNDTTNAHDYGVVNVFAAAVAD